MADDLWCSQVVVHGIIALLAQSLNNFLRLGITFVSDLNAVYISNGIHQFLQSTLSSHQSLVGEIDGAAIVG